MPPEDPTSDPEPYIQCTTQNDTVGKMNARIATGFYEVLFDTRSSKLTSACTQGFFGNASEYCAPCYSGASCVGYGQEPVSIAGFFIGDLKLDNRSDPCKAEHRATRVRCLAPRPCDPPESCIGACLCAGPWVLEWPPPPPPPTHTLFSTQARTNVDWATTARRPCTVVRRAPRGTIVWLASAASAQTTLGSSWPPS
jgi:hypothetical protein